MKKSLLDLLLERNLIENPERGKALILAGKVKVGGQPAASAAERFSEDVEILVEGGAQFVGRGAEKLLAALDAFSISPQDRTCADIGSSTGGFTDVLLQKGASKVFAVDNAYGELDWKLRSDDRVSVMERTNAMHLEGFEDSVDLVVVDVSLLSIVKLLPKLGPLVEPQADFLVLVKPQYEALREELPPGAVITDPDLHRSILTRTIESLAGAGFFAQGLIQSPIKGGKGNTEFMAYFRKDQSAGDLHELLRVAL